MMLTTNGSERIEARRERRLLEGVIAPNILSIQG